MTNSNSNSNNNNNNNKDNMKSFDVQDCVAFVTGTNKKDGIGRALVDALLKGGAKKVYATARNTSQLDELVQSYPEGKVVPIKLDVTDKEAILKLGEQCPDVNLVINNSGHAYQGNSLMVDPENVTKEFEINVLGPLRIVQSFESNLKKKGKNANGSCSAALVTVASITSFFNLELASGYGASKAAVHYLTDAHRRDLGENALVVGLYPGPIETDMTTSWDTEKATPASVAGELLAALKGGKEHVFPDPVAKKWINEFLEHQNEALRQ
jgi:NAD(P)-dependent dehydrogenase (short-subunit alcohol dehydrogenase family)